MDHDAGVGIVPKLMQPTRPEITKASVNMWKNAKVAYLRDKNFETILQRADISEENQKLIVEECLNA